MCFQIPKKIVSTDGTGAIVEGNQRIVLGDVKATAGDYVLVYGNIAVEKIAQNRAISIRKTINIIDRFNKKRKQL